MKHKFIKASEIKKGDTVIWAFDGVPGKRPTLALVVVKDDPLQDKYHITFSGERTLVEERSGFETTTHRSWFLDRDMSVIVVVDGN